MNEAQQHEVSVEAGKASLSGNLNIPQGAEGMVVFAHGSGSSRLSPRNRFVAETLNEGGLATLLFDLLTDEEEAIDLRTRELRFDIGLLSKRLAEVVDWVKQQAQTRDLNIGLFGSSTGAAAALVAAERRPDTVAAVVSRGGRPDLAGDALPQVKAPTLLIVGGNDTRVIEMNREAAKSLQTEHQIEIIPGAGHLFEEPGKLAEVARLARDWFKQYIGITR